MAYSHEELVIRALSDAEYGRLSIARLADCLPGDWPVDKVRELVTRLESDEASPVALVKGGVQYLGTERGRRPGLYKAAKQYIPKWAARNGIRHIRVIHTSRSPRRHGVWSEPDLLARIRRRADAQRPELYVAIEVEQQDGFDVRSVYQIYEAGRGADLSWVLYTGPSQLETEGWARIETAARDLKVGVIHMAKATAPSTWSTQVSGCEREPSMNDREAFLERLGLSVGMFES